MKGEWGGSIVAGLRDMPPLGRPNEMLQLAFHVLYCVWAVKPGSATGAVRRAITTHAGVLSQVSRGVPAQRQLERVCG